MFSLSKSEVRQVLEMIDLGSPFGRRDYLLILFLYHTGLRDRGGNASLTGNARGWSSTWSLSITSRVSFSICRRRSAKDPGVGWFPSTEWPRPASARSSPSTTRVGSPRLPPRHFFKIGATGRCRSDPSSSWWPAIGKKLVSMSGLHPIPSATRTQATWCAPGFRRSTSNRSWAIANCHQPRSTAILAKSNSSKVSGR